MYKKIIFFAVTAIFFMPTALKAQFNTILPKKKIEVRKEAEAPIPSFDSVKPIDTVGVAEGKEGVKFDEVLPVATDSIKSDELALLAGSITLPLDTISVTSRYGKRVPPCKGASSDHKGIDLNGRKSLIYSVMAGKVKRVGSSKSLGNFVIIEHGDFLSIYGHMSSTLVMARQYVAAGQIIGVTGSTGISTGDHLHFAMKYKNDYMDPEPFIMLAQTLRKQQGK